MSLLRLFLLLIDGFRYRSPSGRSSIPTRTRSTPLKHVGTHPLSQFSSRAVASLSPDVRSHLHTTIIPDLLAPTAYDEVFSATQFNYVVHVASPIRNGGTSFEKKMIKPAIQTTLNIPEAAERAGIKRVVITSSVVGMVAMEEFGCPGNKAIYDEKSRTPDPDRRRMACVPRVQDQSIECGGEMDT